MKKAGGDHTGLCRPWKRSLDVIHLQWEISTGFEAEVTGI